MLLILKMQFTMTMKMRILSNNNITIDAERNMNNMNTPEPMPSKNQYPAIWDLVIEDMRQRDQSGQEKYNTRLQPFNGRNSLLDAYQEALDLAVYLRQKIYEETGT